MNLIRRSTLAMTLATLAACSGGAGPAAPTPEGTPSAPGAAPGGAVATRVAPRGELNVVEVGGIAPDDTVLTVRRGVARTLVLRHGPPDRAEFLELRLPATVFANAAQETIHVTVTSAPGIYGATLSADADWGPGAVLIFKYAVHFYPPIESIRRYGTLNEVDRRLVIARRERNGELTLYLSTRPAPDVLSAVIPGPGTYVMVVGK